MKRIASLVSVPISPPLKRVFMKGFKASKVPSQIIYLIKIFFKICKFARVGIKHQERKNITELVSKSKPPI